MTNIKRAVNGLRRKAALVAFTRGKRGPIPVERERWTRFALALTAGGGAVAVGTQRDSVSLLNAARENRIEVATMKGGDGVYRVWRFERRSKRDAAIITDTHAAIRSVQPDGPPLLVATQHEAKCLQLISYNCMEQSDRLKLRVGLDGMWRLMKPGPPAP